MTMQTWPRPFQRIISFPEALHVYHLAADMGSIFRTGQGSQPRLWPQAHACASQGEQAVGAVGEEGEEGASGGESRSSAAWPPDAWHGSVEKGQCADPARAPPVRFRRISARLPTAMEQQPVWHHRNKQPLLHRAAAPTCRLLPSGRTVLAPALEDTFQSRPSTAARRSCSGESFTTTIATSSSTMRSSSTCRRAPFAARALLRRQTCRRSALPTRRASTRAASTFLEASPRRRMAKSSSSTTISGGVFPIRQPRIASPPPWPLKKGFGKMKSHFLADFSALDPGASHQRHHSPFRLTFIIFPARLHRP
jgi:hypothetical protein